MAVGIWVLNDQLDLLQAALASSKPDQARVVLVEAEVSLRQRPHLQKQILFWSAQRHFAQELRRHGWTVDLLEGESHGEVLSTWQHDHGITELRVMEPADRPIREAIERLCRKAGWNAELIWLANNHFLWSPAEFRDWAGSKKQLRMEFFYREGRRRFDVLMEGDEPLGGRWNFDQENRKSPPRGLEGPTPMWFKPDAITTAVIRKLEGLQSLHELPGSSRPFKWGTNRVEALDVLENFITTRLAGFGPYQDAMVSKQTTLWHSLISPYINLGLLRPLEVIKTIERRGLEEKVPLASLEGVIRQLLGWREFTYGLYHHFGSQYPTSNALDAKAPLPLFLQELGGSGMGCVDTVLTDLKTSGYAHHIQRLMVLTNLGLLAGLEPQGLTAWFKAHFIDAHDWVMQTNVVGMGLWADGGRLGSKPYAASGRYINKMSDYCKGCRFNPAKRSGADACPFNVLYWDFMARHAVRFRNHPRMALMIRQLERIDGDELKAIRATAAGFEWAQPGQPPCS
ncbi:MAG: cryptochrome/photolyase family protein [Synechococcus sp. TMED19]|nr:MAG: cryptochrome/photolyase family protein [Synechococcus sp. TMED19]